MVTITKQYTFEAAHILPNHKGKCARLHGHSYKVEVSLTGPVYGNRVNQPDEGMVVDFADLDVVVKPLIDMLDHKFIAKGDEWPCASAPPGHVQVIGIRTTAENLAQWFCNRVWVHFGTPDESMVGVRVWETVKSSAYATSTGELP